MADLHVKPVWDAVTLPAFPALNHDIAVDVVVIGAGMTGITAAFLLKQSGCRVALLERRKVGGTDTGCTSAHLTVVLDADLPALASSFGRDHARAAWDAGFAAIHQIDTSVTELGIDCEFDWVPGFRHVPADGAESDIDRERSTLGEEAALARELGFDVEPVVRTPLIDRPGWRIENQAVFHPRKYLRALLDAIPGKGSIVCEESEVTFDAQGACWVGSHRARAPWVVVATHDPLAGRSSSTSAALLQTRLGLFTSYVASASLKGDDELLGCYWDTSSPYRYVRVDRTAQGLRVIAGGEDHKTGQMDDTRDSYAALERWVTPLVDGSIHNRWSGQVIETNDSLPIIGEVSEKQFTGTGFGGNGMTFGTLTAMMARDAITGVRNPWSELFGPDRSALAHKPWDYLRQNADYPYYLVRDRFAGAQSRTLRAVRRGSGRIVDVDGRLVAAFRDKQGKLTTLSPTCTHMGCRVGWNTAEQTWDCPCHGSRFNTTGEVLAGPAARPLEPVDLEADDVREKAASSSSRP
jgi:glycine/D-amino acid oxidase-like deaminating enzyme/nitrite reductase/ring-hydroxylating ferredoxin subunit